MKNSIQFITFYSIIHYWSRLLGIFSYIFTGALYASTLRCIVPWLKIVQKLRNYTKLRNYKLFTNFCPDFANFCVEYFTKIVASKATGFGSFSFPNIIIYRLAKKYVSVHQRRQIFGTARHVISSVAAAFHRRPCRNR